MIIWKQQMRTKLGEGNSLAIFEGYNTHMHVKNEDPKCKEG